MNFAAIILSLTAAVLASAPGDDYEVKAVRHQVSESFT